MPQDDELLSPHFHLSEFTTSQQAVRAGIRNEPGLIERANLKRLAWLLEDARTALGGAALLISSGFRSPTLNNMVGGAPNSAHLTGRAADFTAPTFGDPRAISRRLVEAGINYDQLIFERGWVHLGIAHEGIDPRHKVLTAFFSLGEPTRYEKGIW